MKSTGLIALVVAAVAAAGAAALVTWSRGREAAGVAPAAAGEPLLKGLADRVNDVAEVNVKSGGSELTIRHDAGGEWKIAEKGGYAAKFDKVRQVIAELSLLTIAEAKTSKPELYSKIGVQDPGAPAGEREQAPKLVTLKDGQGQALASVIVGNPRWDAKPAVYVRRAGEAQSWLAQGQVDIPARPVDWMATRFLELPRERVKGVTVTHADAQVVAVSREKATDANFTVRDVPAGKELRSPSVGDPLAISLGGVDFEDVTPAAAFKTEGEGAAKPKWTADFRTFDGLVLVIEAFDQGGKVWARIKPAFDETAAAPAEGRAPGLKAAEDVKKEAADLSAKFSPWVYELPEWKASSIGVRMETMLKETPPAPPPSLVPGGTGVLGPTGTSGPTGAPPKPATGPTEPPKTSDPKPGP